MQIDYLLTCDYVIQDKQNRTSAIGIFDSMRLGIPAPSQPYVLNPFWLAVKLLASVTEGSSHALEIMVRTPDGGTIRSAVKVPFKFSAGGPNLPLVAELVVRFQGIPLPRALDGAYSVELVVDGVVVGGRTLYVTFPPAHAPGHVVPPNQQRT